MYCDHMLLQIILPIETLETTTIRTSIKSRKEMNSFDMPFQFVKTAKRFPILAPLPCAPKIAMGFSATIPSLARDVKVVIWNLD